MDTGFGRDGCIGKKELLGAVGGERGGRSCGHRGWWVRALGVFVVGLRGRYSKSSELRESTLQR